MKPEEVKDRVTAAIMGGPVARLRLVTRTPALFLERRWPAHPDLIAYAIGAVGLVALDARHATMKRPKVAALYPRWSDLAPELNAGGIVDALDLWPLLDVP